MRRVIGTSYQDWPERASWQMHAPFVIAGRYRWQIYGDDWTPGREHESGDSDFIPANARLIAAAPDLLDALKQLVERDEPVVFSEWLDVAKAAIAKAEGR